MTDQGRRYLIERMNRSDSRRGGRDRRDYEDERDYEYEDERDYEDQNDYYDSMDSRRGVKGTGRGRRRNRMGRFDGEDYHTEKEMKLTKADMNKWKHNMHNTDGTRGEHYDMQQIMQAAEKLGVRFKDYDEKEFCLAVNMFYSDYGHILKRIVPDKEKELLIWADFAKSYFDDPDGPEPSEKLARQYHCLVELD